MDIGKLLVEIQGRLQQYALVIVIRLHAISIGRCNASADETVIINITLIVAVRIPQVLFKSQEIGQLQFRKRGVVQVDRAQDVFGCTYI
ncbi:hypothetical protein D9M68_903700 [compost metagenome]